MKNVKLTLAAIAALSLFAAEIFAQATETGGAAGFAGAGLPRLDAVWASNNHVKASAYFEDYDNDTLENWAEAALGTSPWTNDLTSANAAAAAALGALDTVPAGWKAAHGFERAGVVGDIDTDYDGWNNWSEWMAGSDPNNATDRPNPCLSVTLDYHAALRGRLVIWVYSRFDMNGWPDAVYARDVSLSALPATINLTDADLIHGHLRRGRNWFYAWLNLDGSSVAGIPSWTGDEPAAVADNQLDGIGIGLGRNSLAFHLTDKAESFARVSWHGRVPNDPAGYHVLINGAEDFLYHVRWPRTWVHEWDIVNFNLSQSNPQVLRDFGLSARNTTGTLIPNNDAPVPFPVSVMPETVYRSTSSSGHYVSLVPVTNWLHKVNGLPAPVLYGPVGREIVADARPEFRFSLDPEFTEFQFVLKRVNLASNDSVAIFNQRVLAPGRFWNDATGRRDLVIWRFPYSVGDRIVNGANSYLFADGPGFEYGWTVVPYSPAIRTAQTALTPAESVFATVAHDAGGAGAVTVDVSYPSATVALDPTTTYMSAPYLRVSAYLSPDHIGPPEASIQTKEPGVYTLSGLALGRPYYIVGDCCTNRPSAPAPYTAYGVGYAGGRRPVPVFAEPSDMPASYTNSIIVHDAR